MFHSFHDLRKISISSLIFLSGSVLAQANNETSLPSIPDHFQNGGIDSTKGYENQAPNEVVDTFSGKLQYHFTDLFIPGAGGMDLAIQRSYNSINDPNTTPSNWATYETSPVGIGWIMHMGRVLRGANKGICSSSWTNAGSNPVLELPDGRRQVLYESNMGPFTWITKDFWRATCPAGYLHVQSPDGTTYEMTAMGHSFGEPGSLQKTFYAGRIVDRNGNWLNLSYAFLPNGIYALSQITASDGRSVSFAYTNSVLSTITDNQTGRVWTYTVSAGLADHKNLTEVQRPDGRSWRYAYQTASPGLGSLRRVEYPSGGSIDYVYADVNFRSGYVNNWLSTVVSQKTALTNTEDGGSGTWSWIYEVASQALPTTDNGDGTFTYQYSIPPEVRSQVNITTITDPLGNQTEYYHNGMKSVDASPTLVGLYHGRVGPKDRELVGRDPIVISSQNDVDTLLGGTTGGEVWAWVTNRHWKARDGATFDTAKSSFDSYGNPGLVEETGTEQAGVEYKRSTALTYAVDTSRWLLRQVSTMGVTVESPDQPAETYQTSRQYDTQGNMTSETRASVTTSHTYTTQGDKASTTDALSRITTYSDHFRGIARQEVQPEGVTINRLVSEAGNVTSETTGRGHATTYAYDGLNRMTQITPPVGAVATIVYGDRTRTVTRGGMVDELKLDGLGRALSRRVSGTGVSDITVNYRNDILGRRVFTSYPNLTNGMGQDVDALGRPVAIYHNAPSDLSTWAARENIMHLTMGTWQADANSNGSYVRYRSFGDPDERQILQSMQGFMDGNQVYTQLWAVMKRNAMGQLTQVTMGDVVRSYGYDSRYYMTSSNEPETGATVYGRDAVGNMTSRSVGGAPAVQYTYDGRNRLTNVTYPVSENVQVANAENVVKTYDANDQLSTLTAGPIGRTYTYDADNKLTAESLTLDSRTFNLAYSYDNNDALATVTYPSGRVVNHQPDSYGRARAAAPYVTSVTYHPNGQPENMTYANGLTSSMGLHARQWPSSLQVTRPSGYVLNSSYGYDSMGHLTGVTDSADGSFNRQYSYDSIYRLTWENVGGVATSYIYDNRNDLRYIGPPIVGLPVGAPFPYSHTYDTTTRRLASVAFLSGLTRTYTYDTAGNVSSDGIRQYGHDRANQMRCVQCGTGSETKYGYDGLGMRVKTQDSNGQITYSVFGQNGLLMMTEIPGLERREYIYVGRRQVADHRFRLN